MLRRVRRRRAVSAAPRELAARLARVALTGVAAALALRAAATATARAARGVRAGGRGGEAGALELAVQLQGGGDPADVLGLLGLDERDADAGAARAAGAADAVHVGLAVVRRVEV